MAKFRIDNTFVVSDRGFVLAGQIVDGTVQAGMEVHLPLDTAAILPVKISSVDFLDDTAQRKSWICLVLPCFEQKDQKHLRSLALEGKTIEVVDGGLESHLQS